MSQHPSRQLRETEEFKEKHIIKYKTDKDRKHDFKEMTSNPTQYMTAHLRKKLRNQKKRKRHTFMLLTSDDCADFTCFTNCVPLGGRRESEHTYCCVTFERSYERDCWGNVTRDVWHVYESPGERYVWVEVHDEDGVVDHFVSTDCNYRCWP